MSQLKGSLRDYVRENGSPSNSGRYWLVPEWLPIGPPVPERTAKALTRRYGKAATIRGEISYWAIPRRDV